MAVRVRPVEAHDADAWTRMRQSLWPSPAGEHAGEVRAFFDGRLVEPDAVLLAVDDGEDPIGFVELSIRSHAEGCEPGRIAYVEGWFVAESHRRRGVGRALIAAAEEWGRQHACAALASDAELENAASQTAHRRLGFAETGRIVCFAKSLRLSQSPAAWVARGLWLSPFDRYRPAGPLLIRLFVAFVLIYGTQDNVFDGTRMLEFRDFLAQHGFPWPLASAYLSAYAQFAAGVLIALGLFTRWASALMVVNFAVALGMVHANLPFNLNIAPLAMLFGALFLLFFGAGPFSLDARLRGHA